MDRRPNGPRNGRRRPAYPPRGGNGKNKMAVSKMAGKKAPRTQQGGVMGSKVKRVGRVAGQRLQQYRNDEYDIREDMRFTCEKLRDKARKHVRGGIRSAMMDDNDSDEDEDDSEDDDEDYDDNDNSDNDNEIDDDNRKGKRRLIRKGELGKRGKIKKRMPKTAKKGARGKNKNKIKSKGKGKGQGRRGRGRVDDYGNDNDNDETDEDEDDDGVDTENTEEDDDSNPVVVTRDDYDDLNGTDLDLE